MKLKMTWYSLLNKKYQSLERDIEPRKVQYWLNWFYIQEKRNHYKDWKIQSENGEVLGSSDSEP